MKRNAALNEGRKAGSGVGVSLSVKVELRTNGDILCAGKWDCSSGLFGLGVLTLVNGKSGNLRDTKSGEVRRGGVENQGHFEEEDAARFLQDKSTNN